jgi:NTE family protein
VEAVLLEPDAKDGERVCFVVDLFARDGRRPTGLESALARKNDLVFANQTWQRLELHRRVLDLEARLADAPPTTRAIFYLSYRASPDEAGPEKMFDLSGPTARDRWTAGKLDVAEALRALETLPRPDRACLLHAVRRAA